MRPILDVRIAAPGVRDRARRRRRRRSRFLVLFSFNPDLDNLFRTPGDAVRPPRATARRRAGKRFSGSNRNLFLIAALALATVAAFFGGSALTGVFIGRAPALRVAIPAPPAVASASGSPSASATRLNQMKVPRVTASGTQPATPRMSQVPAVAPPTPTAAASPAATGGQLAATVTYAVVAQLGVFFEAEVEVTNDGSSPISDWRLVVDLPGDRITRVANATGYWSSGFALLQPASPGSAIYPGATLRVYLDALGTQTVPEFCTFDTVNCG